MTQLTNKPLNLLEALRLSLGSMLRTPDGQVLPAALLWTDPEAQWRPVVPKLQRLLPHIYVLGDYDPPSHMGPAIWLKCIVDRSIEGVPPLGDAVPILYLPGVGRQELRAGEDCDPALQPLIELQFRGRVWHQPNGRDWSVEAFLASEQGLGLDVALDAPTRSAMLSSLRYLAETPAQYLMNRRLEAEDFNKLAVPDPVRNVLLWMIAPERFREGCDQSQWNAFCGLCRAQFNLNPESDDVSVAAKRIIRDGGAWDEIWRRFSEAPANYLGMSDLLRVPQLGQGEFPLDLARQPSVNDDAEDTLRTGLESALALKHLDACQRVLELEGLHGNRRKWVWAQVGESPLAIALQPLAALARSAMAPLRADSLEAMTQGYVGVGWMCDRAAIEALAVPIAAAEAMLVARLVRCLYQPWLTESAERFQALVGADEIGFREKVEGVALDPDACILFVDGLRLDLAHMLQERLEVKGLKVAVGHRMTPFPTVTATAKPMASPAYDVCTGGATGELFQPLIAKSGQPATVQRLRDELQRKGVQILGNEESAFPASEAGGWTETGHLDSDGHDLGVRLVHQLGSELDQIAERVDTLLKAGWKRIRIVTDHGWLLLPRGLPRVELPPYLVETKWARAAEVKGQSAVSVPTVPWHWNPSIRIATPPGIACFRSNHEYAHGGLSLQECIVPDLMVEPSARMAHASIKEINWIGLRCRIGVEAEKQKLLVDLRLNWKRQDSSIAVAAKELNAQGEASLIVEDKHEGAAAAVVVCDEDGLVLDHRPTTVGGQ